MLLVSGSEGGVPAPGRDGARATTGRRCPRYTRRARIGICGMDQDWSTGEKRTDGISRPAKRKKSADGSCRQQSRTPVYNSGTKVASRHRGLKAKILSRFSLARTARTSDPGYPGASSNHKSRAAPAGSTLLPISAAGQREGGKKAAISDDDWVRRLGRRRGVQRARSMLAAPPAVRLAAMVAVRAV